MRSRRDPDLNTDPHPTEALSEVGHSNLLWHFATDLSRDQIAELMPAWTVRRCWTRFPETIRTPAIEGDDGRFHLWSEDGMVRGSMPKRARVRVVEDRGGDVGSVTSSNALEVGEDSAFPL